MAGFGYFFFYSYKSKAFSNRKIQVKTLLLFRVKREIFNSIFSLICYVGASYLIYYLNTLGMTQIYTDLDLYGWFYFIVSIGLMILIHDAYFYWTHKLLHHPVLFKLIHKTHHLSTTPSPWAAFSFHPLEAIISTGILPIIVFLVPCHPFALTLFYIYMTYTTIMGHLGFEIIPFKFRKGYLGKWISMTTDHDLHHQGNEGNYGLYFTIWDKLMKTYIDETF